MNIEGGYEGGMKGGYGGALRHGLGGPPCGDRAGAQAVTRFEELCEHPTVFSGSNSFFFCFWGQATLQCSGGHPRNALGP